MRQELLSPLSNPQALAIYDNESHVAKFDELNGTLRCHGAIANVTECGLAREQHARVWGERVHAGRIY